MVIKVVLGGLFQHLRNNEGVQSSLQFPEGVHREAQTPQEAPKMTRGGREGVMIVHACKLLAHSGHTKPIATREDANKLIPMSW